MLEITIEGGPDQGVQAGGRILADALHRAGATVRAFAVTDCESRDVAVIAMEGPEVHYLLVLDPAHLDAIRNAFPGRHGTILVNSEAQPCWRMPGAARVVTVDAAGVARRVGLGPLVAPALVGAFAAVSGLLGLDDLVAAVSESALERKATYVAACTSGYQETAIDIEPPRDPTSTVTRGLGAPVLRTRPS